MTKDYYESAVAELKKFCEEGTNFEVAIIEDVYPLEVRFVPSASQISFFPEKYVDSDGEVGYISVFGGIEPTVLVNLKLTIGNSLLKKLISKAEKVAKLYLHYKCEEAVLVAGGTSNGSDVEPDIEEDDDEEQGG